MKNDKLKELEKLYATWSTEDLIKATKVSKSEYESDAINAMLKELERRGVTQKETDFIQADEEQRIHEETETLSGLRGFLLLFLILIVLNSFLSIGMGLSLWLSRGPNLGLFLSSIPMFIVGVYGIITFVLLSEKRFHAPVHAKRWLVLTFIVNLFYALMVFFATGEFTFSVIGSGMFTGIWFVYLSTSKRVAVTYSPETTYEPSETTDNAL